MINTKAAEAKMPAPPSLVAKAGARRSKTFDSGEATAKTNVT
jgi:hypothetical protein